MEEMTNNNSITEVHEFQNSVDMNLVMDSHGGGESGEPPPEPPPPPQPSVNPPLPSEPPPTRPSEPAYAFTKEMIAVAGQTFCRDYIRNLCNRDKQCQYRHYVTKEEFCKKVVAFCHDYQNQRSGKPGCIREHNCKYVHGSITEQNTFQNKGIIRMELLKQANLDHILVVPELPEIPKNNTSKKQKKQPQDATLKKYMNDEIKDEKKMVPPLPPPPAAGSRPPPRQFGPPPGYTRQNSAEGTLVNGNVMRYTVDGQTNFGSGNKEESKMVPPPPPPPAEYHQPPLPFGPPPGEIMSSYEMTTEPPPSRTPQVPTDAKASMYEVGKNPAFRPDERSAHFSAAHGNVDLLQHLPRDNTATSLSSMPVRMDRPGHIYGYPGQEVPPMSVEPSLVEEQSINGNFDSNHRMTKRVSQQDEYPPETTEDSKVIPCLADIMSQGFSMPPPNLVPQVPQTNPPSSKTPSNGNGNPTFCRSEERANHFAPSYSSVDTLQHLPRENPPSSLSTMSIRMDRPGHMYGYPEVTSMNVEQSLIEGQPINGNFEPTHRRTVKRGHLDDYPAEMIENKGPVALPYSPVVGVHPQYPHEQDIKKPKYTNSSIDNEIIKGTNLPLTGNCKMCGILSNRLQQIQTKMFETVTDSYRELYYECRDLVDIINNLSNKYPEVINYQMKTVMHPVNLKEYIKDITDPIKPAPVAESPVTHHLLTTPGTTQQTATIQNTTVVCPEFIAYKLAQNTPQQSHPVHISYADRPNIVSQAPSEVAPQSQAVYSLPSTSNSFAPTEYPFREQPRAYAYTEQLARQQQSVPRLQLPQMQPPISQSPSIRQQQERIAQVHPANQQQIREQQIQPAQYQSYQYPQ